MRGATLVALLISILKISAVAADCSALSLTVQNFENSRDLLIQGSFTDPSFEGSEVRVIFDEPVSLSVTNSWGVTLTQRARQVRMVVDEYHFASFGALLLKEDTAELSVARVKVDNVRCRGLDLGGGGGDDDDDDDDDDSAEIEWSWQGDNGPVHWESLGFADCGPSNMYQSPFNIETSTAVEGNIIESIEHGEATFKVSQSHGAPKFSCKDLGSCGGIVADGVAYDLLQFHFHSNSEYSIDGGFGTVTIHLVHISEAGGLLVLGRIFHTSSESNAGFERFWSPASMRAEESDEYYVDLNPKDDIYGDAITAGNAVYQFQGSLTTPPCSGGVQWLFLGTPGTMSNEQAVMYRDHQVLTNPTGDARPLQPANGREILVHTF